MSILVTYLNGSNLVAWLGGNALVSIKEVILQCNVC